MPFHVLHLPKWYPHRYDELDGDFVARHVAAIAAAPGPPLQSAVVFATVARGPLPTLIEEEADLSGPVPVWRYYYRARPTGLPGLDKLLKLGLWLVCLRRGLCAVHRNWGGALPDVVHAHVLLRSGLLAAWLRWWHGVPYILTEHWTGFLPVNAPRLGVARRWLAGWAVRQAAAFAPVSADLANALMQLGGLNPRTVVIPNAVDTDLFYPSAVPAQRRGLLHVAAFNEQAKNLSGLLRVVARLRTARPELAVSLRVAGYGPAAGPLHQLAAALGLLADGTVTFLGKLSYPEVAAEMRQAACFVLFSNYENLPCVLIEAQASGLPAVATRVGGVPELLPADGTAGLLVPPGDEAALAAAIAAVLTAAPGRFATEALRQRAVARFSLAAVGTAYRHLYAVVLAARR